MAQSQKWRSLTLCSYQTVAQSPKLKLHGEPQGARRRSSRFECGEWKYSSVVHVSKVTLNAADGKSYGAQGVHPGI